MTRPKKIAAILLSGAMLGAVAIHNVESDNHGCPAGTTWGPNVLTATCDRPNGDTACVEWAFGFTPHEKDQNAVLTYVPSTIPDVGTWCTGATNPPPGLGG